MASLDELYMIGLGQREATLGSSSTNLCGGVADADGTVRVEVKEGDESLHSSHSTNKLLNLIVNAGDEYGSITPRKPKIQKVQPMLREVESNKRCYDPRVVSIGPCHHGNPDLEPVEKLKIPLAREYVRHSKATIDELYKEVVLVAGDARKCYAEGLTERFNDEEFTQMMFLDGCFVLQYIYREKMITAFITRIRGESPERAGFKEQMKNFFRESSWCPKSHREVQLQDRKEEDEPIHLLELVRRQFIDPKDFQIGCYITSGWYSRRSAKDFKAVGIRFRPSKTHQFTDIGFKPTCTSGILTLPPIIIDDTTKSMLLNLAAYEACPDNANDFGDEQVANLFNEIATELSPSPHSYVQVKVRIEEHHKSSIKPWIAEWHNTYFRSPWTFIAVTAAILAITLSVIQTVLAALQTYLTAYPPTKD
ncbi:hypothetical protein Acr_00g0049000 [Actinidia rufa]|uniref:Transmembrane protein n=1 Tax=Actinidia rufa TaxID=165716 RepID=A0A7J0DK98_9ERIC|nr:hypothetical protein Acr_00g0049000 [Actinidia rufa]